MDAFQSNLLDTIEDRPTEIAEAVLEWVRDAVPSLVAGAAMSAVELPPLPCAIVDVTSFEAQPLQDERFPELGLQEIGASTVYLIDLRLYIGNDDEETADAWVKASASRLRGSIHYDGTLGGRVHRASRNIAAEFGDLLAEYGDGVRARAAAITMAVADIEPGDEWA